MKIAHLAEAFGMNCEVHDSYNPLNNVAARHVMMAIDNADWLEVLAFNRAGDDWALINSSVSGVLS